MMTITAKATLESEVEDWVESKIEDGYTREEALREVTEHGCQSGCVSDLIYYKDTDRFYGDHRREINTLIADAQLNTGLRIESLFAGKWDLDDPTALDTHNRNLLAWFGFEETANRLLAE